MSAFDPDVYSYEEAVTLLLRRFSGRLSDHTLSGLWTQLGVGEWAMMETALFGMLEYENVVLTPGEVRLLESLPDDPSDFDPAQYEVAESDDLDVRYTFSADAPDTPEVSDPAPYDAVLTAAVTGRAGIRRLWRAWRQPHEGAACPGTWVYAVEAEAVAQPRHTVLGLSSVFVLADLPRQPVEPTGDTKDLPPYQEALTAAAQPVWEA